MNYPVYCFVLFPVALNGQREYVIVYRIFKSDTIADTPFYIINHVLSKLSIYGFLMFRETASYYQLLVVFQTIN